MPAGIAPASGTPQGATINTAFAAPFVVGVIDSEGDPVPNATVTFAAPASGASAQLSATTVHTGVNGLAQVTGIANGTAGNYAITASVSGVAAPANFNLTNLAGVASAVASAGGTPQSATVNTAFGTPLGVTVTDAGSNPVSGITVAFSAPSSGASATFAGDGTAITDGNGHAQINATANTVAGNYNVTAHVNGAPASASFALTNAAGPAYLALPAGGTPQSATVLTPFAKPLSAKVTDAYGNPISGVMITFTAPASGASATFPPGATTTITVTTDANGMVQVNATANSIPGSYDIVASGTGLATSAVFHITNSAGATPQGSGTSGNGQGANVLAAFQCLLQIKVTSDGTTPLPGVSIDFVAPGSGPSAVLSNGITSGTTVTTITDTNGLASATATANNIAGTYAVSAGVTGSGAALASYTLTNFSAGERLFATGFETLPATCSGH